MSKRSRPSPCACGMQSRDTEHLLNEDLGIGLRPLVLWLTLQVAAREIAQNERATMSRAAAAGFADAAHMTRTFRRMFGVEPTEVVGLVPWVLPPVGGVSSSAFERSASLDHQPLRRPRDDDGETSLRGRLVLPFVMHTRVSAFLTKAIPCPNRPLRPHESHHPGLNPPPRPHEAMQAVPPPIFASSRGRAPRFEPASASSRGRKVPSSRSPRPHQTMHAGSNARSATPTTPTPGRHPASALRKPLRTGSSDLPRSHDESYSGPNRPPCHQEASPPGPHTASTPPRGPPSRSDPACAPITTVPSGPIRPARLSRFIPVRTGLRAITSPHSGPRWPLRHHGPHGGTALRSFYLRAVAGLSRFPAGPASQQGGAMRPELEAASSTPSAFLIQFVGGSPSSRP